MSEMMTQAALGNIELSALVLSTLSMGSHRMLRHLVYLLIVLALAAAIGTTWAADPKKEKGDGSEDNADSLVFALWAPDQLWYPGKIEKEEDGKLLVRFLDGDTQLTEKTKVVRHSLKAGSQVYANWKNRGLYFAGSITKVDGEKLRIKFDSGEVEDTTIKAVRLNLDVPQLKQVGSRVMARWKADGYSYPASIIKTKDDLYQVEYDDGTKEWLEGPEILTYTITPGDRVEANWLNRGLYYRGTVTARKGKNVHINYDDGDEEDTTVDKLRLRFSTKEKGK
jgi:hypothetical protein